jgi:hypothetical protein
MICIYIYIVLWANKYLSIYLYGAMSQRSKRVAFSVGSLREEVDQEIDQEAIDNKLLSDIRAIDLNLVDCISAQIIFCAVLVKFSLNTVCAFANIVPSLCVLPIKIRGEVLKLLHPHIQYRSRLDHDAV